MFENKTIIDTNGYVIEKCVLYKDEQPQYFTLEDGQQAVEYLNKTQIINGRNVEYLKPQWNGTAWIETVTQEELNLAYPPIENKPSLEEQIKLMQEAMNELILGGM